MSRSVIISNEAINFDNFLLIVNQKKVSKYSIYLKMSRSVLSKKQSFLFNDFIDSIVIVFKKSVII